MKKNIIAFFVLCILSKASVAQDFNAILSQKAEQKQQSAKDAADQKINFKSVVTNLIAGRYYQALVKNGIINQGDGELKIKSTIYGLIRIFDSTKREKTYFEKFRWARNTEFGAGVELDKNNKIQAFNPSLTIAILNKREYKGKANFFDKNGISPTKIEEATKILDKAISKMEEEVNVITDPEKRKEKIAAIAAINDKFNKSAVDFSIYEKWLSKEEIKELGSKWKELTGKYDSLQKKLSGAPLLTYGYEGGYSGSKWNKLNNKLEFLVGFGGTTKDTTRKYDFYAGVFYDITQDTLNKLSSLNRNVFTAKIGVNKVLFKHDADGSSIIEVFGGAEYQNISKGIYTGEKKDFLKLDLTFSFRLAKNLYLPFELKYNATTGRFEGYLDLKFDVVNIFK